MAKSCKVSNTIGIYLTKLLQIKSLKKDEIHVLTLHQIVPK